MRKKKRKFLSLLKHPTDYTDDELIYFLDKEMMTIEQIQEIQIEIAKRNS